MRALAIAPQPFFSPRGTPFSVYYRTLVLRQLGVEVDLLTYGQGEDPDLPGVRIIRIPRFGFLGPVPVGPSALKLFLDGFLATWTVALLARRRYDFVHAHEESVFFSRYLKPIFRFKLVYDMHSSLPQQLGNFAYTRSRFLVRLFERLEDGALSHADAVITISPALADYARARLADPGRHFLIENSIFEEVKLRTNGGAGEAADGWESHLPAGRPVVAYAGTFESYQGIDLLLAAFARLREGRPDAFLLMIGGTPEQVARYREQAAALGAAEGCLFTGRLPQAAARRLLERADVVTSPRTEGSNTPLKIYEQLACGKPLVATRILSHTQVLGDDVCFLADPEPAALAAALRTALDGGDGCRARLAAARDLYERRYSRAAYEGKMRALLGVLG